MTDQSRLIILDAIDGAGKSTVIRAMTDWLEVRGLRLFDLVAYMRAYKRLPEISDPLLQGSDVLLSAEPTYAWIGAAIREEIIKTHPDRQYDGFTAAYAFALDRQILFSRVILPYLAERPRRWVIQDRSLLSSLAYQPLQDERVTFEWLLSLQGNQHELSRPPDLMLLLTLSPEEAMRRLQGRGEKIDGHIYETHDFQSRLVARYRDPVITAPYREAGTRIVEIDASQSPQKVGKDAIAELRKLEYTFI